jgi:hypothetical protein
MGSSHRCELLTAFAATLMLVPCAARATLGGDATSVVADGARMKASVSARQAAGYVQHEMVQATGVTVREYVSAEGRVFAVAWAGPALPDLQQVLGASFDRYVAAAAERRIRRAPIVIRDGSLVLVTGGHPRALTGRAYLPDLVPVGVDPEALP